MNIVHQREHLNVALFESLMPLLHEHWAEIAHFKDIPLEPDLDTYLAAQAAGNLRVFTARDTDDHYNIVGYIVYFVRHNIHYRSSKQAVQDILYLRKTARVAWVGYHLIKWCDEQLRAEGVQVVYQHSKIAQDFGPILRRLTYEPVETIYARRLDSPKET
jgi:GNAT superfamily N-acetyltransferase